MASNVASSPSTSNATTGGTPPPPPADTSSSSSSSTTQPPAPATSSAGPSTLKFKKGSIASITNPATESTPPSEPLPASMDQHGNNMYYYNNIDVYGQQQQQPSPPLSMTGTPFITSQQNILPNQTYSSPTGSPPSAGPTHTALPPLGTAPGAGPASGMGQRRRVSPESLVSLDAPTQPRRYVMPSATSRKDAPSIFRTSPVGAGGSSAGPPQLANHHNHNHLPHVHAHSHAPNPMLPHAHTLHGHAGQHTGHQRHLSDEEDDELAGEEPPSANATDQEKIEWKRRQNTLAARRSRKRKLMYTQQLESTVEKLTMEKEKWKTRTMTLRHLLHSNGIPCPDFND